MKISFQCAHCGKPAYQESGAINRAHARGLRLFCGRVCSGFGRRKGKTKAQLVAEKAAYDKQYRANNLAKITADKQAYFQRTYDPVAAAEHRKTRMPRHVEYCRRPEYKAKKSEYDRKIRAREFGDYADCYLLLLDIDKEVNSRMSDYEVRLVNGTYGKTQQRGREYERLIRSST